MGATKTGQSLFELGDEIQQFSLALELAQEAGDEDQSAAIDAWLQTLEGKQDAKIEGYIALIREVETRAQIRLAESRRLKERSEADTKLATRLRDRLLSYFDYHQFDRLETTRYQITVQSNGGVLPIQYDVPPNLLPKQYQRRVVTVKIEPDGEKIRRALGDNKRIRGARFGTRGRKLVIR